jgi:PAS domain S-box-containing protein
LRPDGWIHTTQIVVINTIAPHQSMRNIPRHKWGKFIAMNSHSFSTEDDVQHFFEASLDNLCIASFDGYFIRLNPAWQTTLGYSLDELMAVPYLSLVHPDDVANTSHEAKLLSEGTETVWFENRYRCFDGTYKNLQWKANSNKEKRLIYASARDVTGQRDTERQLRETTKLQRAILDSANLTIIATRPDGIILTFNASALRELGYTEEEVIGRVTPAIIHDPEEVARRAKQLTQELGYEVPVGFETFVAKAGMGQLDENEWTYIRKDGTRFTVMLSVTALRDENGAITGYLGIGKNITKQKLAEADRVSAENRIQAILDNSPTIVYLKDLNGRYQSINRRFEELIHMTRAEILGKSDADIFPPELADTFYNNDRKVMTSHEAQLFEETIPHDDGPHCYIVVKFILNSSDGIPYAVCGIATDITEIKRAQQQLLEREARFRAILDNAMEGFITMGDDLRIESFNVAAVQMFGYQPDEVLGQRVELLLPDPDAAEGEAVRAHFLETTTNTIIGTPWEVQARHKDGTLFPVELAVSVTLIGGRRILTGIVHDITRRRKFEEDLRRSNQDLEQFAYIASHDLKEPLRMISSYLQLLDRRYSDKLDGDARQFIGFAVDGALRLRSLIDDLLEFSRVGTHGAVLQPTDTEALLHQTCEDLQVAITEANAEVTHDVMPLVLADAGQLRQVFQNLITNALKFRTDQQPKIHISSRRKGDYWQISVTDNGIGIEKKDFDRVFVIFQRLHQRDKYEGTGIGLALCKKIIERHGGRIWLESELGKGTQFIFTLPAVKRAAKGALPMANGG